MAGNITTDPLWALSDRELQLYERTIAFKGTIEERTQQLDASDISQTYKQVHREYWQLVQSTPDETVKLEALKRLTFLNWYAMAEPYFCTGLDVDLEVVHTSFALLDEYLAEQRLDTEFRWMLSYYSTWDYAILTFIGPQQATLKAFVQAVDSAASPVPYGQCPRHSMDHRGKMGRYWQSVGIEAP